MTSVTTTQSKTPQAKHRGTKIEYIHSHVLNINQIFGTSIVSGCRIFELLRLFFLFQLTLLLAAPALGVNFHGTTIFWALNLTAAVQRKPSETLFSCQVHGTLYVKTNQFSGKNVHLLSSNNIFITYKKIIFMEINVMPSSPE